MAYERFDDDYENITHDRNDFITELKERCSQTIRYELKPEDVSFFYGVADGDTLNLSWLDGMKIKTTHSPITPAVENVWKSDEAQRIGLFISFKDGNGQEILAPLSQLSKLSLGNRSKLTFSGEWDSSVSKLALAKVYEDLFRKGSKKETVQIISVYGKVQAIMTSVYSPIGHDEFFETIDQKLTERFGQPVELRRGYISNKWSRATWYLGEFQSDASKRKIQLGLSAMDSQTGHSGAGIQPVLFSGRKNRTMVIDDDGWYSKHMALTEEGIAEAIDTVYMTLNDNAQRLMDTISITLKNPGNYARKICAELNKLAKSKSGVQLPQKTIASFTSAVEGLGMIRSNITVWDVIEMLWDIPETTGTCENHIDGLMKTVSRVLVFNHRELDKAS